MAANVLTERYLYLPSVAFCWLAGRIAQKAWDLRLESQRGRALLRVILCAAGIVLAALGTTRVWARARIWHDDMTLYRNTLETDSDSYIMHMNMGVTYFAVGDFVAAEKELQRALELKPDSANVLNALGCVYIVEDRSEEAAKAFQSAIAFKPRWTDPHFNYGRLLKKTGQNDEALTEFQTAVQVGPLNGTARLYLAQELAERGQDSEAETEYRKSIQLSPSLTARRNLADILLKTGREDAAVAMLQQISKEYPFDSTAHVKLGRLLEKEGKPAEARKEYQASLVTDPANSEAQAALRRLKSLGE